MTDPAGLVATATSPVVLILLNLLWVVVVVGGIVGIIVWLRRRRNTPDPSFVGAPIAHAVVVERKSGYRKVGGQRLYRIAYQVQTPDGRAFTGWEKKWLTLLRGKPMFAPGTRHQVAYRPGMSDEVRSLTPST